MGQRRGEKRSTLKDLLWLLSHVLWSDLQKPANEAHGSIRCWKTVALSKLPPSPPPPTRTWTAEKASLEFGDQRTLNSPHDLRKCISPKGCQVKVLTANMFSNPYSNQAYHETKFDGFLFEQRVLDTWMLWWILVKFISLLLSQHSRDPLSTAACWPSSAPRTVHSKGQQVCTCSSLPQISSGRCFVFWLKANNMHFSRKTKHTLLPSPETSGKEFDSNVTVSHCRSVVVDLN